MLQMSPKATQLARVGTHSHGGKGGAIVLSKERVLGKTACVFAGGVVRITGARHCCE